MPSSEVEIRYLTPEDCHPALLLHFNRYREVKRCWRCENGAWVLKDIAFTEQWDEARKTREVQEFAECLRQGGAVIAAYDGPALIGFAAVCGVLFGSRGEYLQLHALHVSYGHRNRGIGKALFREACAVARRAGAGKLYISAHSAEETQGFYRAAGCRDAEEISEELYRAEPFDRHLEYVL